MKKLSVGIGLVCLLLGTNGIANAQAAQQTASTIAQTETNDTVSSSIETTMTTSTTSESRSSSQETVSSSETPHISSSEAAADSAEKATTPPEVMQRSSLAYGYATVIVKQSSLYDAEANVIATDLSALYQQTYQIQSTIEISGQLVYGLWSNQQVFIGYLAENAITRSDQPLGGAISANTFGMLMTNSILYRDQTLSRTADISAYLNKTLHVAEVFHHYDGSTYSALSDQNQTVIGYVRQDQLQAVNGAQGLYQPYGSYVTITKNDLILFQNFDWDKKNTTQTLVGKTYLAKGKYAHFNGTIYLSLYDSKNKWIGYIPQSGTKVVQAAQGNYQSYQKYVTITGKNYDLWQNFSWKSKQKSKNLIGQTVYAKGRYQHFNGSIYLSLYDKNNRWLGYLNQTAVAVASGKQGVYQSYGKTVTVTKDYSLWQNFGWQKKSNGQQYYNQLLTARGKYQHFNGSTYFSLYTAKGKWVGYINQNGVKLANTQKEKMKNVQKLLNSTYKNNNMSIYVMSLVDGETASRNSTMRIHPASTGKLPALYYTQKMILEKKLDADKKYTYKDAINQMPYSYMRGGAGILQGKSFGQQFSLKQIQAMTARYSDNQGANFLGYYGANQYDSKMRNEISRIIGRTWTGPFTINAKENALLMQAIYNQGGQLINDLSNTVYDNQRIAKYLPVKVAHKIGDLTSVAHDIAIIYTDQPYVLSVMTRNTTYETIAKLSKQIYDIMK